MIDEEQLHDFIIIFIGRSHGRWIESKQKMKNEENTHTAVQQWVLIASMLQKITRRQEHWEAPEKWI